MGLVYVRANVSHGDKEKEVDLLVDSGATYSLLKKEIWEELGLRPLRELEFILADGTRVTRKVSECYIRLSYEGSEGHTPVIMGEKGDDENLLGIVTLEILGLMLDPLKREIRPARLLL